MSWLSRVANAFRSSSLDRALDEETAFHIDSRVDELVAGGMKRDEAEWVARRQFGWRCQKQPCTKTASRCLGNTRSGVPGKSAR